MKVPSLDQALQFIDEAASLNPGNWISHCKYTAEAARRLAQKIPGLDADIAYSLGLLHDIGRRSGMTQMKHIIDGYNFLISQGFEDAAKICLTHSFPCKDTNSAFGKWDCSDTDRIFVDKFLHSVEYNDYDRLIQLCDYVSLPKGFCILEKRMIDVALRYGTNDYTINKWKAIFEIKDHFEKLMGCSIYSQFPNIVENTFNIKK